jgi:TPR repeat protein
MQAPRGTTDRSIGVAFACVLLAACSRSPSLHRESPDPSASVIAIGEALGTCADIPACERECDAGSADRCRRLAASFAFGHGVEQDETHAAALYEHACDLNDPFGCVFAGQMSEFERGVRKDDGKAARFYERACNLQWAPGCYNLAIMYERGTGVPVDREKAAALYEIACAAGAKGACDKGRAMRAPPGAMDF